jgi:hypothetical protein
MTRVESLVARLALVWLLVAAGARAAEADDVQRLWVHAALPAPAALPVGQSLTPERAQTLWRALLTGAPTARSFAPRTVLARLLREAFSSGRPVSYATLLADTARFRPLVVVRPDGYACAALTGAPLASLGRPVLLGGQLHVQHLRVGAFYFDRAGVFFAVDEALAPWGQPQGELPLGRDPATAALLGSQQAVEQMAEALAALLLHPVRSLEGLHLLPSTLAGLIATSPEYFARYGAMNLEDQVHEASRLATHVLTLQGGLASQGARLVEATRLPVLGLSARGELVVRVVALPAGSVLEAVGAGAASASVVLMAGETPEDGASGPPPPGGPGRWERKPENMTQEARRYQARVTGAPEGWVYRVRTGPGPKDFVDFDGFREGVLLEAKGPGYEALLRKMQGKPWFEGVDQMLEQAKRQLRAAKGAPVEWHVAEQKVADLLRELFREAELGRIKIIPTPNTR